METERRSMTMSGDSTRDVLPRLSAELRVDFEPLDVRQLSIAMRSLHDYITLPCPSSRWQQQRLHLFWQLILTQRGPILTVSYHSWRGRKT